MRAHPPDRDNKVYYFFSEPPNTPLTPEQAQVVSELASTIKQNAFQLSTGKKNLYKVYY